jgi:hypothetical protein
MIPNCEGCIEEMQIAFDEQEAGRKVALEGMGERKHCWVVFDWEMEKSKKKKKKNQKK